MYTKKVNQLDIRAPHNWFTEDEELFSFGEHGYRQSVVAGEE